MTNRNICVVAHMIAEAYPDPSAFIKAAENHFFGKFINGTPPEIHSEHFGQVHAEAKRISRNGERSRFFAYVLDMERLETIRTDNRSAAERMRRVLGLTAFSLRDRRHGLPYVLRELRKVAGAAPVHETTPMQPVG